jgi:hypothetical protein
VKCYWRVETEDKVYESGRDGNPKQLLESVHHYVVEAIDTKLKGDSAK